MKIRPVGAELFYADGWTSGQTDMTKLIVAIRNFAKAAKNISLPKEGAVAARLYDSALFISTAI
jgi:hypothetical protein